MRDLKTLLWVDCSAGALVGVAVLTLSGLLADLTGLPRAVLLFTGAVNLLYASYSVSLAVRTEPPRPYVTGLVAANLAWVPARLGLAAVFWDQATVFGRLHLVGEAVFAGGLAVLEWRAQDGSGSSVTAPPRPERGG